MDHAESQTESIESLLQIMRWQFEKVRNIAMAAVTEDEFTEYPIEWRDAIINRFTELPEDPELLQNTEALININYTTYTYMGKASDGLVNDNIWISSAKKAEEFVKKVTMLNHIWQAEQLSDYEGVDKKPLSFDRVFFLYTDPTPGSCNTAVVTYPGQEVNSWSETDDTETCFDPVKSFLPTFKTESRESQLISVNTDQFGLFKEGATGYMQTMLNESGDYLGVMGVQWSNSQLLEQIQWQNYHQVHETN